MVNMYACTAATNNSIILMNKVNNTETGATATDLKINIKPIKLNTIMWPAVMLANKRIVNDIGFTNIPTISIGARNNFIGTGTPGIQKMCFQ